MEISKYCVLFGVPYTVTQVSTECNNSASICVNELPGRHSRLNSGALNQLMQMVLLASRRNTKFQDRDARQSHKTDWIRDVPELHGTKPQLRLSSEALIHHVWKKQLKSDVLKHGVKNNTASYLVSVRSSINNPRSTEDYIRIIRLYRRFEPNEKADVIMYRGSSTCAGHGGWSIAEDIAWFRPVMSESIGYMFNKT